MQINSSLQSDLESLVKVLIDEYNNHKDTILNTLKVWYAFLLLLNFEYGMYIYNNLLN